MPVSMSLFWAILICLSLAAILSIKMAWLTLGGATAMVLMGILIGLAFGIPGLAIIFIFFVSSNLIERVAKSSSKIKRGRSLVQEPRTLQQVLANGGVPLLSAILVLVHVPFLFGIGSYLTSIAGATADTWASEVGAVKGGEPYHIALHKKVPRGLSGGFTLVGSIYGLLGASVIGIISAIIFFHSSFGLFIAAFFLITLMGFACEWLDTVLGGYLQARYQCTICGILTDNTSHCGQTTTHVHGFNCMTNHAVNASSSIVTGFFGGVIFLLF